MKPLFYCAVFLVLSISCTNQSDENPASNIAVEDYNQYVNPMVGTSTMGHTFPGATAPFGMVQLGPQTDMQPYFNPDGSYNKKTYEYCAGYQYRDTTIIGFAHTNFSGTGHSDLGDFLVMPTTGDLVLDPIKANDGSKGFYSVFSHENEKAAPGYYSVKLDDYNIDVELTASERVGFHQYVFPESDEAHIILDLVYNIYHYDEKNVWTFLRVENDSLITGYRQTKGWGRTRKVFFAMQFSKPFKSYGHKKYDENNYDGHYRYFDQEKNFPEMSGRNIRAYFNFDTTENEKLKVKFALSPVSMAGALKNMETEIPHWDFEKVKAETQQKWNNELAKIEVESISEEDKRTFYTALYHTLLSPIVYEDVDGNYRGLDQNIHQSEGFTNYTIFSLWDTYRALHPFFNLVQPSRNNDMIKSMLAHYDQSVHHMLPVWSHYANENWCMIGYHSTTVLADAVVKGVGDFDRKRALNAAVTTAKVPYFHGIGDYMKYGFVPEDKSLYSVSKTLEYAFDDWCIAQIAKNTGDAAIENEFLERSNAYKKVYDPSIGFMRPKQSNGEFRKEFDPLDTHGQGFIEGNAWNYGLYVPHQVEDMVQLMGGKSRLSGMLDSLFTMELDDKYIEKNEDITRDGMIGNYVHGNEPGHHIPFLYNYTDEPYKTQSRVRMIMKTMYGAEVNSLCGNDDAGQMSAWYIFNSLGFYPLAPGSEYYELGSPAVKEAVVSFENGNQLTITAKNQSEENVYVSKVTLNGTEIEGTKISHFDLIKGGELVFEMSNQATNN
ncbi:GH92 family glycosyl hydrolase [Draconibacterium sediminis]|uniref:GH92 family glycosyl hydrolase n=1 Tax=Draconibacterium sediminis TaxID=1544798 RepID=UPI0026EDD9EE|nr:GH92 family glycosyl hydrolase [Draconibacterium sediminis]